jgi:hypothetical protein
MDESIDSLYFNWLCAKVFRVDVPTPSLTYWKLLGKLYETEFVWLLSGDDNRVSDGLELRHEFLQESRVLDDPDWMNEGCSILEMFIAFGRRTAFQTEINSEDWFWCFVTNLGLYDLNDANYDDHQYECGDILDSFVWRTYSSRGEGGIFPMTGSNAVNQRTLEIWYQFAQYLVDQPNQ